MARVYADTAAYEAVTGEPAPANVDALLRAASRVVDQLLRGVVYATDPAGMPTDEDAAAAMSDATVLVAQSAHRNNSLSAASAEEWDSVKIGTVSLSGRSQSTTTLTVAGVPVPPAALVALADVGPLRVVVS